MADERQDIRRLSKKELKDFFVSQGDKAFRANQVYEWLWNKSATSFEQMTSLSKTTRELLNNHFQINAIELNDRQASSDRTIKSIFRLFDNNIVEGVLIPSKSRMTACISSQVGCSLSCKFCATGKLKRERNLDAGEIYDQVVQIKKQAEDTYNSPLTNIVYMGMGEPLLNYANMIQSVEYITSEEGLGMASKRITVSTAGIAKMIRKLGDDEVKFNLALSLHAANDVKRSEMMEINDTNSLTELRDALKYYFAKTKNHVTYEYILFDGFNDSIQDADELYQFTKYVPCKVNIIEYNPVSDTPFAKASGDALDKFASYLDKKGVLVQVRRSRGKDIGAACGQLAGKTSQAT
jgi:23S rRNA (adenine2503-C2)-methyltransferase